MADEKNKAEVEKPPVVIKKVLWWATGVVAIAIAIAGVARWTLLRWTSTVPGLPQVTMRINDERDITVNKEHPISLVLDFSDGRGYFNSSFVGDSAGQWVKFIPLDGGRVINDTDSDHRQWGDRVKGKQIFRVEGNAKLHWTMRAETPPLELRS